MFLVACLACAASQPRCISLLVHHLPAPPWCGPESQCFAVVLLVSSIHTITFDMYSKFRLRCRWYAVLSTAWMPLLTLTRACDSAAVASHDVGSVFLFMRAARCSSLVASLCRPSASSQRGDSGRTLSTHHHKLRATALRLCEAVSIMNMGAVCWCTNFDCHSWLLPPVGNENEP